jgi:uncharacterized membrane protein affecting hemolysin expression
MLKLTAVLNQLAKHPSVFQAAILGERKSRGAEGN